MRPIRPVLIRRVPGGLLVSPSDGEEELPIGPASGPGGITTEWSGYLAVWDGDDAPEGEIEIWIRASKNAVDVGEGKAKRQA